jgi:hypothetical protein
MQLFLGMGILAFCGAHGLTPDKFYKGEGQEKKLTFGRRFSCFPARMIE